MTITGKNKQRTSDFSQFDQRKKRVHMTNADYDSSKDLFVNPNYTETMVLQILDNYKKSLTTIK